MLRARYWTGGMSLSIKYLENVTFLKDNGFHVSADCESGNHTITWPTHGTK